MRDPGDAPAPPPASDGRVLSLSDGVFAFALTLMVLTVSVPTPASVPAAELAGEVRRQWPQFASYALSFWVVAVFWFAHRRLFRLVVADDDVSGWLNVAFLFAVAFLPYPTDMAGNYRDSRFSATLYAASMVVVSLALTALSEWVTSHPRLTGGPLDRSVRRYLRLRAAATAGPFLLSLAVLPFGLAPARACWLLVSLGHLALARFRPALPSRPDAP
jgi:uncharacterized membrane protein